MPLAVLVFVLRNARLRIPQEWTLGFFLKRIERFIATSPTSTVIYATIQSDQRIPCGGSSTIEFSRNPLLPSVLSGKTIYANEAVSLMALPQVVDNMEFSGFKRSVLYPAAYCRRQVLILLCG